MSGPTIVVFFNVELSVTVKSCPMTTGSSGKLIIPVLLAESIKSLLRLVVLILLSCISMLVFVKISDVMVPEFPMPLVTSVVIFAD